VTETQDHDGYEAMGRSVSPEVLSHLGVGVLVTILVAATGAFSAPNAAIAVLSAAFLASLFATFSWTAWNIVFPTMQE
jgi:hypothetical protein